MCSYFKLTTKPIFMGRCEGFERLSHSGATRWPCSLNRKQHRTWLRVKPQQPVLDVDFSQNHGFHDIRMDLQSCVG